MLGVFEAALAELDAKGREEFGNKWMSQVRAALSKLEGEYPNLHQDGRERIEYAGVATQAAYLFAYAMPRAAFTYEFLRRHREALGRPLFGSPELSVVSFGGGPASELVGLLGYLADDDFGEPVESIDYRVYDKDGDWEQIATSIIDNVETDIEVEWAFLETDLAEKGLTDDIDLSDVDLVIFSYIMSELCSLDECDEIQTNVNSMLRGLPSGSMILFIDSKYPKFIKYFQACKLAPGLRQRNDDGDEVNLELPELTPTFERYRRALDREPRMDGNIVSKLIIRD